MYGQIKDFQKYSFFAANVKCEHSCFIKMSLQCMGDLTDTLSQCFLPGVTQETSIWMTVIMLHLCEWSAKINPLSYKTMNEEAD